MLAIRQKACNSCCPISFWEKGATTCELASVADVVGTPSVELGRGVAAAGLPTTFVATPEPEANDTTKALISLMSVADCPTVLRMIPTSHVLGGRLRERVDLRLEGNE